MEEKTRLRCVVGLIQTDFVFKLLQGVEQVSERPVCLS